MGCRELEEANERDEESQVQRVWQKGADIRRRQRSIPSSHLSRVPDLADNRGHVDDAAAAGSEHDGGRGLGGVEDTGQIDVDHGLPVLGLHGQYQALREGERGGRREGGLDGGKAKE